ncbi:hypothetical protein KQX54_007921 [Cotesia glomerata]|uniref:Uncharacterized protein n=1 Tax=Cotesia glomerata TaxID=32391 RepID=A0AAV7J5M7_COTGL|nr:hypothetical protein KQX54_007921 [Cotesia glomerata]
MSLFLWILLELEKNPLAYDHEYPGVFMQSLEYLAEVKEEEPKQRKIQSSESLQWRNSGAAKKDSTPIEQDPEYNLEGYNITSIVVMKVLLQRSYKEKILNSQPSNRVDQ